MSIRVLVVDDFAAWRRFAFDALEQVSGFEIVAEASDGLEAVQRAEKFQPDLILLDIGLPDLSGIEVARRIRMCSPQSRILILSEQRAQEIVREALRVGVHGYVVKSDAGQELLSALNVVLAGERFVSLNLEPETMAA